MSENGDKPVETGRIKTRRNPLEIIQELHQGEHPQTHDLELDSKIHDVTFDLTPDSFDHPISDPPLVVDKITGFSIDKKPGKPNRG